MQSFNITFKEKRGTERVGNQASNRERPSSAASGLGKEIFEVPPGAGSVKRDCEGGLVAGFVLHTLRVSRENRLIFNRVEPRIISSLRRGNHPLFLCE